MSLPIIVERTDNNYSAYAPDLPGCIATADTYDELRNTMKEAINFHLRGLQEDGLLTPGITAELFAFPQELVSVEPNLVFVQSASSSAGLIRLELPITAGYVSITSPKVFAS